MGVRKDDDFNKYIRSKEDPENKYMIIGYDETTDEATIDVIGGDELEIRSKVKNDAFAEPVVPANVTVKTHSADGVNFKSTFTLTALALPDVADTAALGVGVLFGTLPAGSHVVNTSKLDVGLQIDDAVDTDTPEVGVGTIIATGAVSVLSGTAGFEDIMTGQVAADMAGTATVKAAGPTAGAPHEITTAGVHLLHLNAADTWANTTTQGVTATGTIIVNWTNTD